MSNHTWSNRGEARESGLAELLITQEPDTSRLPAPIDGDVTVDQWLERIQREAETTIAISQNGPLGGISLLTDPSLVISQLGSGSTLAPTNDIFDEAKLLIDQWLHGNNAASASTANSSVEGDLSPWRLKYGKGNKARFSETRTKPSLFKLPPELQQSTTLRDAKKGTAPDTAASIRHRHAKLNNARKQREREQLETRLKEEKMLAEMRRRQKEAEEEQQRMEAEVARLKELREKKQKAEELKRAEDARRAEDERKERERQQLEQQRQQEEKRKKAEAERQRRLLVARERAEAKYRAHQLKLLSRCFDEWAVLGAARRARLEKTRNVLRLAKLGRLWRRWRRFTVEARREREQREAEQQVKREQVMNDTADRFYRHNRLSKYFLMWRMQARKVREQRALERQHELRRKKMDQFLAAIARQQQQQPTPQPQQQQQREPSVHGPPPALHVPQPSPAPSPLPAPLAVAPPKRAPLPGHLKPRTPGRPPRTPSPCPPRLSPEHPPLPTPILQPPPSGNSPREAVVQTPPATESDSPARVPRPKPKLVVQMEQRAKERQEKRDALRRRYEETQKARQELLRQAEEKQRAEEQAILKAIREKRREEKRLAKLREEERQRRRELAAQKLDKATKHYHRHLLVTYGLRPWRRLIEIARSNMAKATAFWQKRVYRHVLARWLEFILEQRAQRERTAEQHYRMLLMRRGWKAIVKWVNYVQQCEIKAQCLYEHHKLRWCWEVWRQHFRRREEQRLLKELEQLHIAEQHANKFTLRFYWRRWKEFIAEERLNKQKERLRKDMKAKVYTWLEEFRRQRHTTRPASPSISSSSAGKEGTA